MADQVGTIDLPPLDGDKGEVKVETEPPADADAAPWGYKPDGTPYKVDPTRYRTRAARAGRQPSAPKSKTGKSKGPDYRGSVLGLVQIIGLPLAAAATKNDVFLADLITLNACAPGIADAVESIALSNPKVATALDKLAEVGPYGLLIGALAPLIIQGACNHGLMPVGVMGAVDPADLIEAASKGEVPGAEDVVAA